MSHLDQLCLLDHPARGQPEMKPEAQAAPGISSVAADRGASRRVSWGALSAVHASSCAHSRGFAQALTLWLNPSPPSSVEAEGSGLQLFILKEISW